MLQSAKNDGVKINVVNIMTMDYGASADNNGQMGQDAISAIIATEKQLSNLGINAQIGVTPMIGSTTLPRRCSSSVTRKRC